ncbi:MAG: T9SS type A sorting domain-containing protein [Ignavibacteriota bacterium]
MHEKLGTEPEVANWTQIIRPSQTYGHGFVVPYFIDENLGFIMNGLFFRTADGGINWTQIKSWDVPSKCNINSVYFTTSRHGYASGDNGIYETDDTGTTWKKILAPTDTLHPHTFTCVYASGNSVFTIEKNVEGPDSNGDNLGRVTALMTTDDGNHWTTINEPARRVDVTAALALEDLIIFGNKDSLVFVTVVDTLRQHKLYYSTNNGKSWSFNNFDDVITLTSNISCDYGWSTKGWYVFPHCSDLLRTHEVVDGRLSPYFYIQHSTDFGKSWENYTQPISIGGQIAGDGNIVYVTNSDWRKPKGLLRSLDFGKTWQSVPGPSFENIDSYNRDMYWRNLSVVSGGAAVFAVSNESIGPVVTNDLWKTTNGGDGTLTTSSPYTNSIHFASSRIINDSFDVTVHLPIYFDHTGTMSNVDMIMHYPDQALKYLNGVTFNGKSIDPVGGQWSGRAALHFDAADLNAAPDSLLGFANFLWSPFEYECDNITFDTITTRAAVSPCADASAIVAPFEGIIGSYKACGFAGVVNSNSTVSDISIHPNPTTGKITIQSAPENIVNVRILNILGETLISLPKNQETIFTIDCSKLIPGTYYVRFQTTSGVVTKKIIRQ